MLAKRRNVQAKRRVDVWTLRRAMAKGWPRRKGIFSRPLPASAAVTPAPREADPTS
jgi:hypothetical protein